MSPLPCQPVKYHRGAGRISLPLCSITAPGIEAADVVEPTPNLGGRQFTKAWRGNLLRVLYTLTQANTCFVLFFINKTVDSQCV